MDNETLRMDVLVHGGAVQRAAGVSREVEGVRYGDRLVPWQEVLWFSRRSGMILVFAAEVSLAIRAESGELGDLEDWLNEGVVPAELRRRLMKRLGNEIVLFAAGSAVDGTLDGKPVRGLFLAAATRRALHLLTGSGHTTVPWPVDRVTRRIANPGEAGGDSVMLTKGDDEIHLRYLRSDEIVVLSTICRNTAPESKHATNESLELFSRKEVSPPPRAELPEFSVAAGALHEVAGRAAANVPGELQARAHFEAGFFEAHFLELGETALGPLLLRKSAASMADSLRKAADAMDASGLQEDTRAAVATAGDRMLAVFKAEARRLAGVRGIDLEEREKREPLVPTSMRDRLLERMQAPFDRLWARFEGLASEGHVLIGLLAEYESGSPGDEDSRVAEAAEQWRATLSRLDSGYVGAWRELVEEIEKTWSTDLLPRLVQMTTEEGGGVPEWAQLTVLGVLTLLLAVALVVVFVV